MLVATAGGIASTFTPSGVELRIAGQRAALSLAGVGRGRRIDPVASATPTATADTVFYRRGAISEFYRSAPNGLEQGFRVSHRVIAGKGPLVLAIRVGGSLVPERVGSEVLFKGRSGSTPLRYGRLSVVDAADRRLPAQIQIRNGGIQLVIDDSSARYPLHVDPFVEQGEALAGGGESGPAGFGYGVALSADGNTALVGGPGDSPHEPGAVWAFTRSGVNWAQQGEKLTVSDEDGPLIEGARFGYSLALSSDGNTALIGGPYDYDGSGAAWVFTRSGSVWQEQKKINMEGSGRCIFDRFGESVALSDDGNTALIGCPGEGGGAAWAFTRSGQTWEQEGPELTVPGLTNSAQFGTSVALSSDGSTALIGAPYQNGGGAAWTFALSGGSWVQEGDALSGSGEVGEAPAGFGGSVALSSDGDTALIGGRFDNNGAGAAWVFTRAGEKWQTGPKLTGVGEVGEGGFGHRVALSSDGNTAMIAGPFDHGSAGAVWEFLRIGDTWTQDGPKLIGPGASEELFGFGAALSSDARTALIGAPRANGGVGSASVMVNEPSGPTPTVTRVSPKKGSSAGGTIVTITGTNFGTVAAVRFGPTLASDITVNSPTSITAVSPPGTTGLTDVTVQTPNGTSAVSSRDQFSYEAPVVTSVSPSTGSKLGGFPVTVKGGGFGIGVAGTTFKFGSAIAILVQCSSASSCTMLAPAVAKPGTLDVRATAGKKTSKKSPPGDQFTYE